MSQLIHVILPSGTRFERTFGDHASEKDILSALDTLKPIFGYNGTVRKVDGTVPGHATPMDFGDPSSGFVYDHPDTQVVKLKAEQVRDTASGVVEARAIIVNKLPVVEKWLKGEPKKPEEPNVELVQEDSEKPAE